VNTKPRKIIRFCVIITNQQLKNKLSVINTIGDCVECAHNSAKDLNYSKKSDKYLQLDLDYGFNERPAITKNIKTLDDLFNQMSLTGLNGKVTYVIDGDFDSKGKRILDNSVKIRKIV
jgi:hypothetical protein